MSEAVEVNESLSASVDTGDQRGAAPGSAVGFEEFVVARSPALWRSAYLLTGDPHKAEDLVQTALTKAWRRWSTIARDGAVEGYVRRTLVTTYTDWWRRKWNAEQPSATLPDSVGRRDDEGLAVRRDVLAALAGLTRGQRAVVVLRYFDDLTEAQTAEALGCSIGTVKSQHARAMAALRSSPLLADDEIHERGEDRGADQANDRGDHPGGRDR